MQIIQLNHVALQVADVEVSVKFYTEVLRLAPIPRPAFSFPGAWFRLGGDQELHLIGGRQGETDSHHRGNHWALRIDDMDAWETDLRARGIDFLPRRTRPDGALQIYLVDPDGHYVELCSLP
jgi:catechol 2,3-dioxygenase-like lactoylglutathione lyase family enzyme